MLENMKYHCMPSLCIWYAARQERELYRISHYGHFKRDDDVRLLSMESIHSHNQKLI